MSDPIDHTALDHALDLLSPPRPADPAALERAFRRLTTEMTADAALDTVRRGRLARPGTRAGARPGARVTARRRLTAAVAVAAVAAGVVVAAHIGGSRAGSRPDVVAGNATLLHLAADLRALPAPGPGTWVRITATITQSGPAQVQREVTKTGTVPIGTTAPRNDHDVDVTYRPADLADTSTPWVRQHDGNPALSMPAPADVVQLAQLATLPAAGVAARLEAGTTADGRTGQILFAALSWLQDGAGDPALTAKIAEGLAVLAAQDASIRVSRQGSEYIVSATANGASESFTVNDVDGSISYHGTGSQRTFTMSIASQVVAAGEVPSATAYHAQPTPGGGAPTAQRSGN